MSSFTVTLSGWGKSFALQDGAANNLKSVQLSIFPQNYCNQTHDIRGGNFNLRRVKEDSLPDMFSSPIICAGSQLGGGGSCKGDSGGPLMHFVSDGGGEEPYYVQVGVVHGGIGE